MPAAISGCALVFIHIQWAFIPRSRSFHQTGCKQTRLGRCCQLQTNDPCKGSFNFESVIGYGTISELVEPAQKEQVLNQIMRQYSGQTW